MIGQLWSRHRLLLGAFVVALAVTLFLAGRAVMFSLYWADPAHSDESIAGWMTPRYIAHSWDVPPEVIGDALGLRPEGNPRRLTVGEIAEGQGVPLSEITDRITVGIEAFRAAQ